MNEDLLVNAKKLKPPSDGMKIPQHGTAIQVTG